MYKYYEDLEQNAIETKAQNSFIAEMNKKRNVILAVIKVDGEKAKEQHQIRDKEPFDVDDNQSQSSTGMTSIFKKQKLSDSFKVLGQCGAILAKDIDMQSATQFIKDMKTCMYCDGTLQVESVSERFFFVSCSVLIY